MLQISIVVVGYDAKSRRRKVGQSSLFGKIRVELRHLLLFSVSEECFPVASSLCSDRIVDGRQPKSVTQYVCSWELLLWYADVTEKL